MKRKMATGWAGVTPKVKIKDRKESPVDPRKDRP